MTGLIETWTGTQSGYGSTAKQQAFIVNSRRYKTDKGQDVPLWGATKAGLTGFNKLSQQRHEAALPGHAKDYGYWNHIQYQIPNNCMMKLFGHFTDEAGNKGNGSLLIYCRSDGPLLRVTRPLPVHPEWAFSQLVTEVRADIMTVEEAKAEGVKFNPIYMRSFTSSAVHNVFRVDILENARSERPEARTVTVSTNEGTKQVTTRKRRRAVEV